MNRRNFIDDDIEIIDWGEDEDSLTVDDTVSSETKKREEEAEEPFDWKREIAGMFKLVVFAVVVAFLIDHVLIVNAEVPSGSMENTIMTDSRMIGWRWSYAFAAEPKRGDVVIFKFPDDPSKNYVKRVVALPGERVRVDEGLVYINDEILKEDYVVFKDKENHQVPRDDSGDFEEMTVPKDCYFVLGDNRNNSWDSRYWKTTNFVSKDAILGKAIFCYWHNGLKFNRLS